MFSERTSVKKFAQETAALTKPSAVVWIDGSEKQLDALRAEAMSTGELIGLNSEKLPGCYLHRSDPNDVARVEACTFICCENKDDAGPTNNWCDPDEMLSKLEPILSGSMAGRTMYVVPYSMGPLGSPYASLGVELTDSIYVALSMVIMTRAGNRALEEIEKRGHFVRGVHAKADVDPEKRYITHFPEQDLIIAVNSAYGGNALLGKKCHALRIASTIGRREGWLAEHMLILGVQNPEGEVRYVCGAFPSACGKTNLAMIIPPESYAEKGWKCWTVGDDIAWLHVGDDGRLWAINPENGFFGVAPGTSSRTNPNALASTRKNTIFTNVVRNLDDNTVWWEGLDEPKPENAENWRGERWDGEGNGAHPNSRFTAPSINCPSISPEFDSPQGVPISAIIFGARRGKVLPLVCQARDWAHGVFMGSIMGSETTAAASGKVGVVRRDPMAMRPFCGYNMADYWGHWLEVGKGLTNPPAVFTVNWFRRDEEGHFLWPGFRDNLRVVEWMLKRAAGEAEAVETPLGFEPRPEDINLEGIEYERDPVEAMERVDPAAWLEECAGIEEFYAQFGDRIPEELRNELSKLKAALK